jgi:hypothetical protein
MKRISTKAISIKLPEELLAASTRVADALVALAREYLWEPVSALAHRALAHFGRRADLADLLPREGPLSFAQAEAYLEANSPQTWASA